MSRLQSIENGILEMNGDVFQEMCDSFLLLKNSNYSLFSRNGSKSGKQKSIPGTPDLILLLPSEKYIFVEHSTNISEGVKKLKKDINKCLNSEKTGIPLNQITEIILCINFNLKSNEIQELLCLVNNTPIILTIYTQDSIALELHLNHRDLAHYYLGLPLDTGQIVSIKQFIAEYDRASKGISTPLNNTFLHRKDELQELTKSISSNDFVILTGSPGVGKTKLALEGIKLFLSRKSEFNAYCISYKHHTLLDDLFQYLDSDKNYILFVDDANRIDAFSQIIGFYTASRKGQLKIVITVRDYALQEINNLCQGFAPKEIQLAKFTDEEIIEIIKQEPFNIINTTYHQEIKQIADGNSRLAIMTALLAKEEQDIRALNDVSDLFENYFSRFIQDDGEFANDFNIKCLGLIAFFYTLPYKDKNIVIPILSHFQIEYASFIESIDKLDRLELVELQYDYVKIPEQNLAIYFFYKAFIKDHLLSFDTLLSTYYENNKNRFKDCVIPANNTFGSIKVMDKLLPFLKNYWRNLQEEEKIFNFLSTFWFYLVDESLAFLYDLIEKIPKKNSTTDTVVNNYTKSFQNKNATLELLENFFIFQQSELRESLQLAFEYIKKKPEFFDELITSIRSKMTFERDDEQYGFIRQVNLFKILINGLASKDHFQAKAFYELAKTFLQYQYQQTRLGRNHSFYIYDYILPNNKFIQDFRADIWNAINKHYASYPTQSFNLLKDYTNIRFSRTKSKDKNKAIMQFDIPFILKIINTHLSPKSFEHCHYVHSQIQHFQRYSISNSAFEDLASLFKSPIYNMYLKIDWNQLRDKQEYEFDDYKGYQKLKEAEIRNSFIFNDKKEIDNFLANFYFIKEQSNKEWNYNNSLDFIVEENYKRNAAIGLALLSSIINNNNKSNYTPRIIFHDHLDESPKAQEIWSIITKDEFNLKINWELSFYTHLDKTLVNTNYVLNLISTISMMKGSNTIYFNSLKHFLHIESQLFQIILKIIVQKNDTGEKVSVGFDFFSNYFQHLGDDINLIGKAYIQQDKIQNSFDYKCEGLFKILERNPLFLLKYVNSRYSEHRQSFLEDNKQLGVIWKIKNIEPVLKKVFELVVEKELFLGILKHYCNSFFFPIPENHSDKAKSFLIGYVGEIHNNHQIMNIIVDIARHSMKEIFEDILLAFVSLNQDVGIFSKIRWKGNGSSVHSADVIFGDIEASEWKNILSIIEKSDLGFKIIPLKRHLNQKIEWALKYADEERKRRFLTRR